ncbi:hypothetical protein A0H81_13192 [Grifola frondosa]|uniref:PPPDE domain-containing protein n=1 Tax=Grifola frondosa TaxID=5627 RepID=A0A1C7LPU6_GRIFR|nr:hypothetical protein A0H81_13192 [Grifola frondosa]
MPLPILVSQYNRVNAPSNAQYGFHWEICIQSGFDKDRCPLGYVYHIVGSTASYGYQKMEGVRYTTSENWRGSFEVGRIKEQDLPAIERNLSQVQILKDDPNWNCQNWVIAALRKLTAQGFINAHYSMEALQHQMNILNEQWEQGDI